jgi:hypothetical protein
MFIAWKGRQNLWKIEICLQVLAQPNPIWLRQRRARLNATVGLLQRNPAARYH